MDIMDEKSDYSNKGQKCSSIKHTKITDIFLDEETLTLWEPHVDRWQYNLIPETISEDDWPNILQIYYNRFDCVSSVLPFDDAIQVIAHQATTLVPTHDYSILRDYPRIRGLWYQPDKTDDIGTESGSIVGNVKFSFSFPKHEKENLLSHLNMYYLEVMDYQSIDKSVSRFLLTKNIHKHLHRYDIHKPGGPIFVKKKIIDGEETESYFYLKTCQSFSGKIVKHEVEFMMEEDPWPMCQISTVTHRPMRMPPCVIDLGDLDHHIVLNTRYLGAPWEQSMAGLFAWSLRTHLSWLVYERLHENIKLSVNLIACRTPSNLMVSKEVPMECKRKLDLIVEMAPFVAKCHNEKDMKELRRLFLALHSCDDNCLLISVKNVNFTKLLQPYLSLFERTLACTCTKSRREIMESILPWSVLAYYSLDQKIDSCKRMIDFIAHIDGISPRSDIPNIYCDDEVFLNSSMMDLTERTFRTESGFVSLSMSSIDYDD